MTLRFDSLGSMFAFVVLVVGGVGYCGIYRPIHVGQLAAERTRAQSAYSALMARKQSLESACRQQLDATVRRVAPAGVQYAQLKPGPITGPLPFLPRLQNDMPVPASLDGGVACEVPLPEDLHTAPDFFIVDASESIVHIDAVLAAMQAPPVPPRFGVSSTNCVTGFCAARLAVISVSGGLEALIEVTGRLRHSDPSAAELQAFSQKVEQLARN